MERPAPTRWCPRCCSKAFIGTTKNPAIAPINTMITIAVQIWCVKIIAITAKPMAMPSGITWIERSSATQSEARTAPMAMPNAVTPCRIAALDRSKPSAARAHSMTMNCSVAPAPQKSVVVASEIWPSGSRHRCPAQRAKSLSVSNGSADSVLSATPVRGTCRLKSAAMI